MIHIKSHGKTILTGEHAVIRGAPAVVIPNLHQTLEVHYDASKSFHIICEDSITSNIFETHLHNLWHMGQRYLNIPQTDLRGELHIRNTVPIARGCGFSGAFSVIVAKLLHHIYELNPSTESIFNLGLYFETQFHGSSSGADIAGAMSHQPIWFQQHSMRVIDCHHTGYFYLFDSQQISHTKKCVEQVSAMQNLKIDETMCLASGLMLKGLESNEYSSELIGQSLHLANSCFAQWNLITPEVQKTQDYISSLGAMASKVTGAGGGGYVVGYFKQPLVNQIDDLHFQPLTI